MAMAVNHFFCNFVYLMNDRQVETLKVRAISVGFAILSIVVFRPLGVDVLGWTLCVHFLAIWALGVGICYITEALMKHVVRLPASLDKGVEYIIRRNMWFQIINTPMEALMVCTYLHFAINGRSDTDPLSWKVFFYTLFLLAFCSFAIGMYWRFKFRSRYLAAELIETKILNEQLQRLQIEASQNAQTRTETTTSDSSSLQTSTPTIASLPQVVTLNGSTSESATIVINNLLYVEAVGNYVKIYHLRDNQVQTDMLRTTTKQIEEKLQPYHTIVRCHRAFIANLQMVEKIQSRAGTMQLTMKYSSETIPVSRSHIAHVKKAIAQNLLDIAP